MDPFGARPLRAKKNPLVATYLSRAAALPPGPSAVEDLFAWPHESVRLLFDMGCDAQANRYRTQITLQHGIIFQTDHSGTGNAEYAMMSFYNALRMRGLADDASLVMYSSCDIDKAARVIALEHTGEVQHVFADLMDQVSDEGSREIARHVPAKHFTRQDTMAKYKRIYELLVTQDGILRPDGMAQCLRCKQRCCMAPSSGLFIDPLSILVSGPECFAFSSRGRRGGLAHTTMLTFLVWVARIKRDLPWLVLHENTELHPEGVLRYFFAGDYDLEVFRLSPWNVGWHAKRPRKYTLMVLRSKLAWLGNSKGFIDTFARRVVLRGSDLFCGDIADVSRSAARLQQKRQCVGLGLETLTHKQRQRLERMPNLGADSVVDVEQTFAFSTHEARHFVPTQTRKTLLWSMRHQRLATARETMVMMGIPGYTFLTRDFPCRWADDENISTNQVRNLVGNAMHAAVLGQLLSYVLAHVMRRSSERVHFRSFDASSESTASDSE